MSGKEPARVPVGRVQTGMASFCKGVRRARKPAGGMGKMLRAWD